MMSIEKTPLKEAKSASEEKENGNDRDSFSSTIRLVCTLVGGAIGSGNIWRFPRILARNSGSAGSLVFILVWSMFLFLWSIPMLIIEYAAGRYTGNGVINTFKFFVGNRAIWCAAWILFVTFAIGSYYNVIMGWCFYYLWHSIAYSLPTSYHESSAVFYGYAQDSAWPVLTAAISILLTAAVVTKGVSSIERANLILAPALVVLQLVIVTWSLARPNAMQGLKFMFTPDWSTAADPNLWLDAGSQNAFDTGAGTGVSIAYAAYMTPGHSIVKMGAGIPVMNNVMSIVCGVTTFTTVFSSILTDHPNSTNEDVLSIMQTSGPGSTGLTFIWLPVLLSDSGVVGRIIAVLYFLCIVFAVLSSNTCFMETCSRCLQDIGLSRYMAIIAMATCTFLFGLGSALDLNFLTNQDLTWGYSLLLSGLMLQFLVMIYGSALFRQKAINDYSTGDWYLPRAWEWIVKYVCPTEAIVLLLWWLISSYSNKATEDSLDPILAQWGAFLGLFIIANVIYVVVTERRCCFKVGDNGESERVKPADGSFHRLQEDKARLDRDVEMTPHEEPTSKSND